MNRNQLRKLDVPEDCINICLTTFRDGCMTKAIKKNAAKGDIASILANPLSYTTDPVWGDFAKALLAEAEASQGDSEHNPINYKEWGGDMIDDATRKQMEIACELPCAVFAALMPDAHVGYGLPIGGNLATDNAAIPYAVGVDIACRMRCTIIDKSPGTIDTEFEKYRLALERGTLFGAGVKWQNKKSHPVLDEDWDVTPLTKGLKDKAHEQLGSSGSGNHFVEFGTVEVLNEYAAKRLNLPGPGNYVGLLSHSGSRNPGKCVCDYYSKVARDRLPKRYVEQFGYLAWLPLDTQEGEEYWLAMNLMGQFAAANHEVIHRDVIRELGATAICHVENHHNFAWKETHEGREVIVHRKGATPAGAGVLGVIPGSMGDACYIVQGKGNPDSLNSASHGAGRAMSRKEAKGKFNWAFWRAELKRRNVVLLHGGLDEVPGAYKPIDEVMKAQQDLIDPLARFTPRIVEMDGTGSPAED
jgi:tRNA-splicing ligase RtcB